MGPPVKKEVGVLEVTGDNRGSAEPSSGCMHPGNRQDETTTERE